MKFRDAEKKLMSMYKDRYRSLDYEKTYHHDGHIKTQCTIYIANLEGQYHSGFIKGNTWEEAFAALDKKLNPQNHIEEIPNE